MRLGLWAMGGSDRSRRRDRGNPVLIGSPRVHPRALWLVRA